MKRSQERHTLIVNMLQADEYVSIETMALACGTSTQTIRRDLSELSRAGKVQRYHGGARLPEALRTETFQYRSSSNVGEKRVVANLLSQHIPDGASIFLAGGSTLALAAEALRNHKRLTIVTNNLHAAMTLYDKEGFDVHVVGGWVRTASGSLVGSGTIEDISSFSLDIAVIGTCAITNDGTLLEYDESLVGPINAMIANARKTILAADHSKLGKSGIVRAAHLRNVDIFVTDRAVPPDFVELFEQWQVSPICAEELITKK